MCKTSFNTYLGPSEPSEPKDLDLIRSLDMEQATYMQLIVRIRGNMLRIQVLRGEEKVWQEELLSLENTLGQLIR